MKVMKRFLAMVLTLAMVATLFAGLTLTASAAGYSGTGDFKKCTGALSSGYYVFGTGSATSVNAVNNTVGSSWAVYTATSVSSGTIKNPSTNIVWYYDSSTGKLQSAGSSNYIYWPTTGNTGGVGATGRALTITETGTSGIYNVKVADTPARLFRQNGTSGYRFYSSSTGVADIYFYKLESKTLSSIAVSSNHRTFNVGGTFVKETVTATYSDSSTADVTNSATFSGYNMSSAGTQTVNVSYTEGGVTKTATYQITVTAPTPYTLTYSVNGDTSVISGGSITSGTSVTLPTNVTAPADYTFSGWVASAIGTETTTEPTVLTGSYTMPAANTTLYALFTRTEQVQGGSSDYVKVTKTSDLTDGQYLIVYETGSVALDSSLATIDAVEDTIDVTISNNTIPANTTTNAAAFTFTASNGSFLGTNGKYIGHSGSKNTLDTSTSAMSNTVSIDNDGNAVIDAGSNYVLRYNNTSGQYRFRFYTGTQEPIQLYKKGAGSSGTTYYTTTVLPPAVSHTLTYSASPAAGGSITCASASGDSIEEGTSVSLTAAANPHYTFTGWTVDGVSAGSNATLNITMDADKTVVANFEAEPTYTVTITSAAGGTMTASKTTGIYAGETITLSANANTHYTFNNDWTCTAGGATISGNTFTMPAANVTITGSFTEAAKYTVTFYASSLQADTDSALATRSVYGGEYATAPTPGSKDGFTFLGWYTSSGTWSTNPGVLTSATVNSTAVNGNVTYYGVWAEGTGVGGTFKLVVDGKYVGGRTSTNKYLNSVSSETDAAEFGIEDGGYLYFMNGSTKTYVSNKSDATDLSFSTNKSEATPWTVTETASGISFTTTATGERELAYNKAAPRFAAYQGNATNYPYIFTKIGGAAVSEYTTAPVQVASHTVYWHNGDTYTTTSVKEGTAITAPEAPTKADYLETYYTFAGWSATDGGSVVSSYGNMGSSDMHFYAVFTSATYSFTASIAGADSVKVGRSKTLTGSLIASPTKDTSGYTASWSSSDTSKATVDANGRITGVAVGSAVITATYTRLDGTTVTATKTITVTASSSGASGYTLITQDNEPDDWSGDYIIMGKIGGDTTYMNTWMLLTPNYDGGSVTIAGNNEDAATITITDVDGVGTGTINDEGNASSGVVKTKTIEMEDTDLVTDTDGDDSILVYDTITSIDDHYAFTIECIDDVNQIYTIRVKDTNLYIACAKTGVTTNSLNFDSNATEYAQWQFSVQRVTKGGYNNDIIVAQNIGNNERCLYFNSNSYGATNGQFRDYRNSSTGSLIGGNATGGGQTYNLYLFGNPNPFKAQIYYHGDQITLVDTGKVNANAQTAQLTGALTPDIDNYPNWTQVGDPVWTIVEKSTSNNMTIDSATGLITTNASSAGSYALVKVTYTVHDEVNNVNKLVSTTSKVEVIAANTTYSTVIYELYSGSDTEVQYTIPSSMSELPLAAYVVNDTTDDNSKTGSVVMGGTLTWTITSTSASMFGTFSIDTNGVLYMSNVTKDSIVTVQVTGATGDNTAATAATYKVYVTVPSYTVNIVPTLDSAGTHDTTTDILTVPGSATGAHLTYEVEDNQGNGPSSSTFTTAGYAWTISGDAQGAMINSNGLLDFSEMDRTVDHTITVVVSRIAAIDAATGVISSGLTDTITVVVKAQPREDVMEAVDDVVIIDWALPVTFNVLTNDNINVTVDVTTGTLPSGVVNNGNGSFTFTPSGWQTTVQTFEYTVAGTVTGASATDTATVTLKTADSVYYEDTYSGIFTFTGTWTDLTAGTAIAAQTSSLDTADIFEYDANYGNYAMYSGGTAKSTTVVSGMAAANRPSVSFTFAGTGFDVISATTNNGGAVLMTITDTNGDAVRGEDGRALSAIYDNFRGYTYTAEGYTRYGLVEVTRYAQNGDTYVPSATGGFYYDSETQSYIANETWYNGEPGKYYDNVNQFTEMVDEEGSYIVKEFTSNWLPYDKAGVAAGTFNQDYYQIPIIKVTGLEYGTYTVTLTPTYSSAYDRAGDGSYDFIFDGVRIHNPVENRAAQYKYISIHDAVKNGEGFGSGEVVACDHQGHEWSDWTFYSRARNTTSATTTNRGSFVQYCSFCGGVANTAYFHVAITADNTNLGVGGYNSLPASTMLHYTLTADACENQAAIQAKLDALTGSLTEYWSSNTGAVMTCMNNSNVVIAKGEGTTYATLQLKDPATQTIYASAIRSPMITVYADEDHVHTFGDWTHDENSDPSTHTHTCTGANCSFYETESCVFTSAVTTQPTQSTPGTKTCTCSVCGHFYVAEIPALGGFTATFHVPQGATAPAALTGSSVTMPAAVAAPADFDAHSYTFVGWVANEVSDTTTEQTVYTAGTSVTLNDDTDFYALYSYEGEGSGNTYKKVTTELSDWSGNYMIVSNGDTSYALNPTFYSGTSGEFNTTEVTVSNNTITNSDPDLVWTFTPTGTVGQYSIHNSNGYLKITGTSSTNAALSSTADDSFTIGFTDSTDNAKLVSVSKDRVFSFYTTRNTFRTYASSNVTGHLYKQAGALTYTTNLAATCKHTNTTTTTVNPSCTLAGSTTVTCDACHEVISETPIAALGHYYVPTPAAGGTTYTCSRCNDSYFEADEFEVSYVLQPGVTVSGNSREGNAITLPNAASIPATYNAQSYTFVGWANATSADGTSNPTVYAKGEVVNITADATFYPVYKFSTTTGGGTQEAGYYLADSVPTVGDEIIIAFKSGDTYYALPNGNKSSSASIAAETLTVSNGKATATSTNTFKLITNSDHMAIKSTAASDYLGFNSNKISMNGWGDTKYAAISAASDGMFTVYSSNNSPRGLSYSGTNFTVANAGGSPVYIFTYTEGGTSGGTTTTTYTFELKAQGDNYTVTMSPATLTLFTEATSGVTAMLFNNGNSVDADDYAVEFSSSNDNIVTVDEDTGYVLAGETAGTATITATVLAPDDNYYYATCAVTVKEQSDNVTVNYIGSQTGNVYNWGTRDTTATFLTTPANEYYTGSYSYATLSALSGDSGTGTAFYSSALGTAIHNMLVAKQTSTTGYDATKTLYQYTDCEEGGGAISSYYSAVSIGPSWNGSWNREHTWPDSKGLDGADENDIMMLRPTSVSENSTRGNTAYGEGTGYYDPNKHGQNLHGDVARLMLQHLMRWGNTSKFYGTGGVMESRAILLKWLAEDPVDTWELGRNDAVQRITGVRNVFVDYPELAFKLLGADVPANYTTPYASRIVAAATYSASAGSDYEPVTEGSGSRSIAPAALTEKPATRSIPTGNFGGAAIIDGKGTANTFDDFAAYGPNNEVYLASGQGIVFSLSSDIAITSQDLQIGAKAVNGTAAAIDVASISNGTESTGIKYLLEGKPIASATEMYYELDTTQMGWNGTESSVIVIYNSGSGVLSLTNLRYSTDNSNTLTMNINEVQTQKAAKMIQIVYGEPITDPDPIEPTDLDLNFKSAELVLNSDIAINFNVEEAVMDSADGVYAVFTKALYNIAGEITGYAEETVTEPIFNEETGLYSFRFTGINPAEMGSAVTAQLFGSRDGELVEGKTINYSVLTYINNMYDKVNDKDFRALIADLAAYGAAAQNYISYNTANLVTANTVEGLMACATADAPELNNATAIEGSGAVKFTGAYLSLREKVTVCYMIDASEYAGDIAALELRIYDGKNLLGKISGADFAAADGKYIASFSGLNALQMRTVLTAVVFDGDSCVSNTLDYSIESYAASKAAGNDALAALVNAMMNYGISAETYFAK